MRLHALQPADSLPLLLQLDYHQLSDWERWVRGKGTPSLSHYLTLQYLPGP